MAVDALRCRICESEFPAVASGVCLRCFGPLEPVYDWDDVAARVTRERIGSGPPSLWRYADLLPTGVPAGAADGPGWTPLVRAPRLADAVGVGELYLKLDHTNPTHSFKDRVVAVAAAKAVELGADTLACASTGNLGNAVAARASALGLRSVVLYPRTVEPEKMLATAAYGAEMVSVRGSYDDCSRLVVELAGELDWAFVNVEPAGVLRRGVEDARVRDRRAARLELPRRGRLADRLRLAVHEAVAGLRASSPASASSRARRRASTAARRRAARRSRRRSRSDRPVSPVRPATVAHSLAIGAPADGDLAVATARASGGAIHAVAEDEVGSNMALLARTTGIFGETAAGVTLGALRAAAAAGELGAGDRVVLLVTGTGLKTPQAIETGAPLEIDADVDDLLAELGVTA